MNKYYFLIILVTLFACQKDVIETNPADENFTDLLDTLIFVQWANGGVDFNLDKDSINDINLTVYSYYSKYVGNNDYLKVTPLNGFKIAFKNYKTTAWRWNPNMSDTLFIIDTIMIPKVFHVGDTIYMDDMYSEHSQMISYSELPSAFGEKYYSGLRYGIKESDYFYLGFDKLYNTKSRLAWLKVKTVYNGIILNSCSYIDEEMFVIKEKI